MSEEPSSAERTIGLVLVQQLATVVPDPWITGVERGLEELLIKNGLRLVTRVVRSAAAQLDVYRAWSAIGAVDAVVLVDLRRTDPRAMILNELHLPFAAVAEGDQTDGLSAVVIDDVAAMRTVLEHLTSAGHGEIAFASGSGDAAGSTVRAEAFRVAAEERGLAVSIVDDDHPGDGGVSVTLEILAAEPRPSAIVFDDAVAAAGAVETLTAQGLDIPRDMAVLALHDSFRCQTATPPITAMSDQSLVIGDLLGRCVLETTRSGSPTVLRAPEPYLIERASA